MDYGALPPEVNSLRIYTGPGAGSLTVAASAWSTLAGELTSAVNGYQAVVDGLQSEQWIGPSSVTMAQSFKPYVAWMQSTAAQAERSAGKAREAAAAYEAAFTATVPPPQIAENRALLATLVAGNVVGQNTAAIAAAEAQYSQMWAQDAAAMYQYAGAAAVASELAPYASPPTTTSAAGAATQSQAVNQATANAAGNGQSQISQLLSQLTTALHNLGSPMSASATAGTPVDPVEQFMNWYGPFGNFFYDTAGLPFFGAGITSFFTGTAKAAGLIGAEAPAAAAALPAAALTSASAAPAAASASGVGPVSARLASATTVGKLAVPPSWAGSTPMTTPSHLPEFVSDVIEHEEMTPSGNVIGGIPPTAGSGRNFAGSSPRYGMRPTVVARPPSAG